MPPVLDVTFTASEATLLIAVLLAPVLLILAIALVRGYSILFWHHKKGDRVPFVGIVRPNPEEDDDA